MQIQALYSSFAKEYAEQVKQLITDGSKMLVSSELEQVTKQSKQVPFIELRNLRNSIRIRKAYQQQYTARTMEERALPRKAIDHYRLAKVYAIQAMRSLTIDRNRRLELEAKFRKDLIDARGIASKK